MTEQKKKQLLKAKIAVALQSELGRVPTRGRNRSGVFIGPRDVQSSARPTLQEAGTEEK